MIGRNRRLLSKTLSRTAFDLESAVGTAVFWF